MKDSSRTLGKTYPGSKQVLSLAVKLLYFIGLWPQSKSIFYSLYTGFIFLNIIVFILFHLSSFLSADQANSSDKFETACAFIGLIPLYACQLTVLFRREEFQKLISHMRTFVEHTLCNCTKHVVQKENATEKKLSLAIIVMFACTLVIMVVEPFAHYLKNKHYTNSTSVLRLPISMYPFWDEEDIPMIAAIYFLQSLASMVTGVMVSFVETFVFTLILCSTNQFEILITLIRNVDSATSEEDFKLKSLVGSRYNEPLSAINEEIARRDRETEFPSEDTKRLNVMPETRTGRKRESVQKKEKIRMWRELAAYHQEALRNGKNLCELLRTVFLLHYTMTSIEIAIILNEIRGGLDPVIQNNPEWKTLMLEVGVKIADVCRVANITAVK